MKKIVLGLLGIVLVFGFILLISVLPASAQPTPTPTESPTPSASPTECFGPCDGSTPTESPTPSATVTISPTPTCTDMCGTPGPSPTPSPTPSVTESPTPSPSATSTVTITLTTTCCPTTPTPTCTDVATTYDRSNMGLFLANYKTGATLFTGPTDAGNGEAGSSNMTAISTSDNSWWTTTGARGSSGDDTQWDCQMYKFNVSRDNVSWFEVAWEGYGEQWSGHPITLHIWNYSAGVWEWLDRQEGYDTQDRVLGNRRYELPNTSINDYTSYNASTGGYDLTARAAASHDVEGYPCCPYLFGWNGETYKFVDSFIGTSIIKRFERTTYEAADYLTPKNGYYDLMLYGPFPDEWHINNLGLRAVDHPEGTGVLVDYYGTVHTISEPQAVNAFDSYGQDVTALLAGQDGNYWYPDITSNDFSDNSSLHDWIEITLPDPPSEGVAKIIMDPKFNIYENVKLWYYTNYLLGSPNADYLIDRMENDEEFITYFDYQVWLADAIRLQYWNGSVWMDFDDSSIVPPASPILGRPFVVPIDLNKINGDRIRILIPTGECEIGYVAVDYTEDLPVTITSLEPIEATLHLMGDVDVDATKDVLDEVLESDDLYAFFEQGDYINYRFEALSELADGMERSFVPSVGGYYYCVGPEVPEDKMYNLPLFENLTYVPNEFCRQLLLEYTGIQESDYPEYWKSRLVLPAPFPNDLFHQSLVTDYVRVVTHTCPRPAPTFTVSGRSGNWYLWKVYYNDTDNDPQNWTYWFETLDRTGDTAYFRTDTGADATGVLYYNVSNAIHGDWHLPYSTTARMRRVAVPTVGSALDYMLDAEVYLQPNGSEVIAKAWTLPIRTGTGAGAQCAAQYYAENGNNNWSAAGFGAPWTAGESFDMNEYINVDSTEMQGHMMVTAVVNWTNQSWVTYYNVSNASPYTNMTGYGKFGGINDGTQLFNCSEIKVVFTVNPYELNDNSSRQQVYYYNPSVENFVRKFDSMHYFGVEDNVIVAYESEDFGRSDLVVTDTGAGRSIDVSINITNTLGLAQKFNALLCIMDYDILTNSGQTEKYMFDGGTVYPNVSAPGSSWPYYDAVKTTGNLSPGASETVTWTNAYTLVEGHSYWLWCCGMVYGPWRAGAAPAEPTPSPTPTVSPTPTISPSATPTVSPTPTLSPTPTVTASPTVSPTPSATVTATVTPTASPTPTLSATPAYHQQGSVTASGACGNLSNYQMKLMVHKDAGASNGSDVYLNDHCRDDFGDIRFTKADGISLLDYWVQEYNSGVNATVWVEFDAISTSGTDFYIYYGNPNVSSASNGTATFIIFDDLESGSVNTAIWDLKQSFGLVGIKTDKKYGNYSIGSNQSGNQGGGSGVYDQNHYFLKLADGANVSCRVLMEARRWTTTTYGGHFCGFGFGGTNELAGTGNSSNGEYYAEGFPCNNTWYSYESRIERVNASAVAVVVMQEGVERYNNSSSVAQGSVLYYGVQTRHSGAGDNAIYCRSDNVCVGKYCSPEPAWGSWTQDPSELTPTPSVSPTPTVTPEVQPGDVNNDGRINACDITQEELCILDPVTYPKENYPGWDANEDNLGPNSGDILAVEYRILGTWPP